MAVERFPPDDAREWLRLAGGDAVVAHARLPGAPLELFCFHAQQAAEKALKAVLLHLGIPFPRTHDLDLLLDLLEAHGILLPPEIREAGFLSQYAVQTRYPLSGPPVTTEHLTRALATADAVLRWAQDLVSAEPGAASAPAEDI
jgi:HEPN domain-containing protein